MAGRVRRGGGGRSCWRRSAGPGSAPGANDQGLSRRHIIEACEASLRRLGTDFIDLYQSHSYDPETPLDETLRAFDDLVRAGEGPLRGMLELRRLAARAVARDQRAARLGPV